MINIVVPMAGRGQRFIDAGYSHPKPFIDVNGKKMIHRVIDNILLEESAHLTFICLEEFLRHHQDQMVDIIGSVGKRNFTFDFVPVSSVTEGAACTVLLAKDIINTDDELLIANCDQLVLDEGFSQKSINFYRKNKADGGILCFLNDSPKWSYVRLHGEKISEVVEKQVVSNLATVGIYWYASGKNFVTHAQNMIAKGDRVKGEFYVAPVYNYMIVEDMLIKPYMVNEMVGLGTPVDLENYLKEQK